MMKTGNETHTPNRALPLHASDMPNSCVRWPGSH
jgi:hypothetical protein